MAVKLTKSMWFYSNVLPSLTYREGKSKRSIRWFNEQVKQNKIDFIPASCLCGSEEKEVLASIDRFGFHQRTVICKDCGLIYLSPRMTDEEYVKFYSASFYMDVYALQAEDDEYPFHHKINPIIVPYLDKIESVLEVGCNRGYLLCPYSKAGKKVVGYDLSKNCVEIGKKVGLDLRVGAF
ncbi:MAG: class I SAM-dependent methyltransferase [Desulfarculaceae bacterium]|nr:class I SAM-dependent methyltransferase [Desulfarculaceae bacterium]